MFPISSNPFTDTKYSGTTHNVYLCLAFLGNQKLFFVHVVALPIMCTCVWLSRKPEVVLCPCINFVL